MFISYFVGDGPQSLCWKMIKTLFPNQDHPTPPPPVKNSCQREVPISEKVNLLLCLQPVFLKDMYIFIFLHTPKR